MPPSSRLLLLYRNLQPFSSVSPHQRQQTLKTPQNFTQKSKFLPQKFKYTTLTAKNRHLQLRSPCTIKMCHRIRGFSLFLSPWLLSIWYLTRRAPTTTSFAAITTTKASYSPDRFRSIAQALAKQPRLRAHPSPKRFLYNRTQEPPQPQGSWVPQRRRGVSPSIKRIRELSRISQIKQHSHAVYLPQTTNNQPPTANHQLLTVNR